MSTPSKDERAEMKSYWEEHSKVASIENMMLDTQAETLHKAELPEVLELLPVFKGKRVLELGAGIGRFTGELAKSASHLVAVEFMETFIKENEAINGVIFQNIEFKCADVTTIDFPEGSFDFIFSNWLMMYLTDAEVQALADKMLKWVTPQGHVFFRESCRKQSGDVQRTNNPSKYREPDLYRDIFESVFDTSVEDHIFRFDLVQTRPIQAYITLKNNPNQISWQWVKVEVPKTDERFQKFLDNSQYTREGILRYEQIFGTGFVSTGGITTTEEFVAYLDLKPDQVVLDVGSGIGGGPIYMAKKFGVRVRGIDLSANMTHIGWERLAQSTLPAGQVVLTIADVTQQEYEPETFDVIYSRDTILHIQDKAALFAKFFKWLKPGGRLLISDYCRGAQEPTQHFKEYVAQRRYFLHTPADYGKILEEAGFSNVKAEDRTSQFVEMLTVELARTKASSEVFIKNFGESNYEYIIHGWEAKLVRCAEGDQKWGLFQGYKSQ